MVFWFVGGGGDESMSRRSTTTGWRVAGRRSYILCKLGLYVLLGAEERGGAAVLLGQERHLIGSVKMSV